MLAEWRAQGGGDTESRVPVLSPTHRCCGPGSRCHQVTWSSWKTGSLALAMRLPWPEACPAYLSFPLFQLLRPQGCPGPNWGDLGALSQFPGTHVLTSSP